MNDSIFVRAAKARVKQLLPHEPERIILKFLLDHGIGVQNAKPWNIISEHLKEHEITMSREQFQQGILSDSRASDIFIGSNDHGRGRGYFLIQDRADALTMRDFYEKGIAKEAANLAKLKELIISQWP